MSQPNLKVKNFNCNTYFINLLTFGSFECVCVHLIGILNIFLLIELCVQNNTLYLQIIEKYCKVYSSLI